MLIGSRGNSIGLTAHIIEPIVNREASNYIISHYEELVNVIKKHDIKPEKAQDLLHDVYISIVEAEDNGNGFDMEFGNKLNNDVTIMSVSQFIIGRIKLYAKNLKYRTDIIEASGGFVNELDTYYVTELDSSGQEILGKDGKPKLLKRTEKRKIQITVTSNAATFNDGGDVTENNDDFQKAFATASVADSTEEIIEVLSLREQIEYCIDVCELHNVNIINIFKNMDKLADRLGNFSRKRKIAETIFDNLSEIVEYHTEFGNTLMEVLRFSASNRSEFENVLQSY